MTTTPGNTKEDTHFYLDNAHPLEVAGVLRVLNNGMGMTPDEIAERLLLNINYTMQKDHGYSPRRLYDLGLAQQNREGSKVLYSLNSLGCKVQTIAAFDDALTFDILHYLHFTGICFRDRKYLWSYRRCCELIWNHRSIDDKQQIAQMIQAMMAEKFPWLDFTARQGARFNHTAVGAVIAWLKTIQPSIFDNKNVKLRHVDRYELLLLALDDLYRTDNIVYGDPIILSEDICSKISRVFFIDPQCIHSLVETATHIASTVVNTRDTLAGPSITLKRPFTVEDL